MSFTQLFVMCLILKDLSLHPRSTPFSHFLMDPIDNVWPRESGRSWAMGVPMTRHKAPLSVTFSPLAGEKEALNNRGRSAGDGGVSWVWELAHSLLVSSLTLHVHLRPPQGAFVHPLLLITQEQPCLLLPCSLFKEKLLERQTDNVSRGGYLKKPTLSCGSTSY